MSQSPPPVVVPPPQPESSAIPSTLPTFAPPTQQPYFYQKVVKIDGTSKIRKYQKLDLLGKGGFAECFMTKNIETNRIAATKIIDKSLLVAQRPRLRLLTEVAIHKAMHHPNIVELTHYFEDDKNAYVFLELCQNRALSDLHKIRGGFYIVEVQYFLYGICSGIRYLHRNGIIHRDLKLGNIFIDSKMVPKIGDFGLASKLQFETERKRTVCGTPNFIAPEILSEIGYSYSVDIWSIGVILFILLYGIAPFQTETAATTYQRIRNLQYEIPRATTVPAVAVSLIKLIFVREPENRPTLQQIMDHPFFKWGTGIVEELPSYCFRRPPSHKDLKAKLNKSVSNQSTDQSKLDKKTQLGHRGCYLKNIAEIAPQKYLYEIQNSYSGILIKTENTVLSQASSQYETKFITIDLQTNAIKCLEGHPLLSFLEDKPFPKTQDKPSQKDQRELAMIAMPPLPEPRKQKPLYLSKLTKYKEAFVVRFSDKSLLIWFPNEQFSIITDRQSKISVPKVWRLVKAVESEVEVVTADNNELDFIGVEGTKKKLLKTIIADFLKKNAMKSSSNSRKNSPQSTFISTNSGQSSKGSVNDQPTLPLEDQATVID